MRARWMLHASRGPHKNKRGSEFAKKRKNVESGCLIIISKIRLCVQERAAVSYPAPCISTTY
jgi:hypothetical protein